MATLGSGINGPKAVWEGRDPIYGQGAALRNIAGLGVYTPAWMRAQVPGSAGGRCVRVRRRSSRTSGPRLYDLAPFANRLPDDAFWAARQVVAFTDEDIRAIVQVAQYSDPKAERWIADCLIDRRDRIGRDVFRDGASARRHRRPRRRADLRRPGRAASDSRRPAATAWTG